MRKILLDFLESLLVVFNGIHLVDRNDQLLDTKGPCKEYVLLGLVHDTISGCHDENCSICLRCTGNHVLDEVPVTWAVHDSEIELWRIETLVCDINGDTSLTFFFQVVHHPGEFEGRLTL